MLAVSLGIVIWLKESVDVNSRVFSSLGRSTTISVPISLVSPAKLDLQAQNIGGTVRARLEAISVSCSAMRYTVLYAVFRNIWLVRSKERLQVVYARASRPHLVYLDSWS